MTDDILDSMAERRSKKTISDEYRKIDKEIKNRCKAAKETWFNDRCQEIEDLERKHQARLMHTEVKQLTDRKHNVKTKSDCIQSKEGTLLFENEETEKR